MTALADVHYALLDAEKNRRPNVVVASDAVRGLLAEYERLQHELEETRRALARARLQVEESIRREELPVAFSTEQLERTASLTRRYIRTYHAVRDAAPEGIIDAIKDCDAALQALQAALNEQPAER